MTAKLIKWVIPGLMFVAEVGAVTANELEDSIIPQLGMESDAANISQKDEITSKKEQQGSSEQALPQAAEMTNSLEEQNNGQSELSDETKEEKNADAKKTRFGVGYEYRRSHRPERTDRPQRPERPQRVERPQRPDRPGRFGW